MIVRSAVGATLTKAPKLSQPEQVQSPVPGKTKKTRKPTQKKKKRGEGIKNFFSDFFD